MSKFVMLFVLYVLFLRKVCGLWWLFWPDPETTTKAVTTTIKTSSIHATHKTPVLTPMTTTMHASETRPIFTATKTPSSCWGSCKREDDTCDTPKRKCAYVNDTAKIPRQCIVVLRESCVSEEAISKLDQTPLILNETLDEIFLAIDDKNCNCRNRSIELFCHALLPLCSVGSSDCETITCNKPELKPSCQDYCLNLTNRFVVLN